MLAKIKNAIKWTRRHLVKNSGERWDYKYEGGHWKWLGGIGELAHYSILAGYFQFLKKGGRILEIGCGEGLLQERISSHNYSSYTGIDLSESAIKMAAPRADAKTTFVAADMAKYIPEGLFDAIIFNESLYYVSNPASVIMRYGKFLKPDGIFILSNFLNQEEKLPWDKIEKLYPKYDAIKITNANGNSTVCKVLLNPPQ